MNSRKYFEIKESARKIYKEIGSIQCPALDNETVHFDDIGFRHLVYKGKARRKTRDQIRRFKLLRFVVNIVLQSKEFTYKKISTKNRIVHFWSIRNEFEESIIIIIIRQIDSGRKHFFSIMDKKK